MKEVIRSMKSIIRRYATCMENNIDYTFRREELETVKKAIKYLELIDALTEEYKGDKNEDTNG